MKEERKLLSLIIIVSLTIFLVLGGTFAYWQWATSDEQRTLVNSSLTDNAIIYVDDPVEELKNLYPTSDCDINGTSSWTSEITVDNNTGVILATTFKLKVKIEDRNGNIITNDTNEWNDREYKYYIKYAVTEANGECNKPLYSGRFDTNTPTNEVTLPGWYDSSLITLRGSDGFPNVSGKIGSGVSFHAYPNQETKHTYKVWAWIDKEYTSINYGQEINDPLQNAKISVSWSENSGLEQVKKTVSGEAIAIYSADDNSLRFYREANPASVTVGSTYNGRTVTGVYKNFEEDGTSPWYDDYVDEYEELQDGTLCEEGSPYFDSDNYYCEFWWPIETVVFEDYIYPTSTLYWFDYMFDVKFLDATKLDTSNVTDMSGIFYNFASNSSHPANIIGLENWDTSNVEFMEDLFYNANIKTLNIEKWDTSNVTNMGHMFEEASIGIDLDLSGWDVCNVENDEYFSENTTGNIIKPHFGNPARCNGDTNVGKFNAVGDAYAVYFEEDNSLRFYRSTTAITAGSTFDGRTVTAAYTGLETTGFQPANSWGSVGGGIKSVIFEDYIYPVDTKFWFAYISSSPSAPAYFDISKLDTSHVTNMNYMFAWLYVDGNLDLSNFNTSHVTNMGNMFDGTGVDKIIGLEKLNTSNVTNMYGMFARSKLSNLNLSNWNVCNVTSYDDFKTDITGTIVEPFFGNPTKCNGGNPA